MQMLQNAIDAVPPGRWAVGVSGGADSVALVLLLRQRSDLLLHVVHLDHQTRQGESARDAKFVSDLAKQVNVTCTIATRSSVESGMNHLAKNASARYRRARFALFSDVVKAHAMNGVLLAHHADDQAETVLMRILRGGATSSLVGIRADSAVNGLRIVRPLLLVPGKSLRDFLEQIHQSWCEDASNQSDTYQRNRLRRWLANRPLLRERLLDIERCSRELRDWLEAESPPLGETFPASQISSIPLPLARHAAADWLAQRGAPKRDLSSPICERLVTMCTDAASPPRQHFPGGLLVSRRKGQIGIA